MDIDAHCLWPAGAILGEGPLWSPGRNAVYAVDIRGSRILRLSLEDGARAVWPMEEAACWLVERRDGDGFVAGLRSRRVVHLRLDGAHPEIVAELARLEEHATANRLNDAKADPLGRLWIGSMHDAEEEASGALHCLHPDGTVVCVDRGYTVANGPALSPDGRTLYHTDSFARTIYAFTRLPDGTLSDRRVHIRFAEADGFPDGMTCDAEGGLWVAHWDGGRVSRFRPDGSLDREVRLPVSRVTSCTFAGRDLDRLIITTAAYERPDEPLAGGIFECVPGVAGLPPDRFG